MTEHKSADQRVSQILQGARDCFVRAGYEQTRMTDIAEASGLSKGGVYFHFDSKKEIIQRLVREEYESDIESIREIVDSGNDITQILTRLGRHFLENYDRDNTRLAIVIAEMAMRDEDIGEFVRGIHRRYIDLVAQTLEEAKKEGNAVLQDFDPEVLAVVLKAILDGIQASMAVGVEPDFERILANGTELLTGGIVGD